MRSSSPNARFLRLRWIYRAAVESYDVVVVGGGIVGLATARAVLRDRPDTRLLLLEKEAGLATHQTGRNSGVIHSGIYYPPGSLKARMVAAGRRPLLALCSEYDVPVDICGKVIVATDEAELPGLRALLDRGQEHGLNVRWLDPPELREHEPHATGVAAVHVRETGITDFAGVAGALGTEITADGGVVRTGTRVIRLDERPDEVVLATTSGDVTTSFVVVCAGLHADELAFGPTDPDELRIVPFRGEYYALRPEAAALVNALVYPVPDPRFPFLGVHFTRGVDGGVHVGPNAVLAFAPEGYRRRDVSGRELIRLASYPGMYRLARRHWRRGAGEIYRSFSKAAFTRAAQRLLPALTKDDLVPAPAGVRAQALRPDGTLVDDFAFRETRRVVHVVNAPSPAATASLAIGAHIAGVLADRHR